MDCDDDRMRAAAVAGAQAAAVAALTAFCADDNDTAWEALKDVFAARPEIAAAAMLGLLHTAVAGRAREFGGTVEAEVQKFALEVAAVLADEC